MSFGGGTGRRKHKRWFEICSKTKSYSQAETAVHRYLFSRVQLVRNTGSNPVESSNFLLS
jgi:hypothetical protein